MAKGILIAAMDFSAAMRSWLRAANRMSPATTTAPTNSRPSNGTVPQRPAPRDIVSGVIAAAVGGGLIASDHRDDRRRLVATHTRTLVRWRQSLDNGRPTPGATPAGAARAQAATRSGGRLIVTVVPTPGSLASVKRPRCSSMSARLIGRPRPAP